MAIFREFSFLLFNNRRWFATNTKPRYLYSSQTRRATTFQSCPPGVTCSTCMPIPRPYYVRGVLFIFAEYLVVRSTYVHVHTCLEEEYRIINQYGSCTLRSLRLLCCCFPLNRRQISSGIPSSPLFATATKTQTSKGLAWRLNKSACNSGNYT